MASSDNGDWGKWAFTGVAALFVGGVFSACAGHGLIAVACWFAAVCIAIKWIVPARTDSHGRDKAHNRITTRDERKQIARDVKNGSSWMHVDYGGH